MRSTDYQINFLWPLIVFIATFVVSDYSLTYACQVTVIYIILAALFRFVKMVYAMVVHIRKTRWKNGPGKRKDILSALTVFIFIFAAVGIIASDKTHYFSTRYSLHKLNSAMKKLPLETIKLAMLQIKNHPNHMRYCSPMFFPSLKNNDPQAIATYLAYYALSTKYCGQYWDWGRENCGYLKEFNYGNRALEARQNIRLCEFARDNQLANKVNLNGGVHGQAK